MQVADSSEGRRGNPGELLELSFVSLCKVGIVILVRELQQAIITTILSNNGNRKPATHSSIVGYDIGVNAKTYSRSTILIPGGIFRRERKVFAHPMPVTFYNECSGCLVCPNNTAC